MKYTIVFLLLLVWIITSIVLCLSVVGAIVISLTTDDFWFVEMPRKLLNFLTK